MGILPRTTHLMVDLRCQIRHTVPMRLPYIDRQSKAATCGPIAITNCLLWTGHINPRVKRTEEWMSHLMPGFLETGYDVSRGVRTTWITANLIQRAIPFTSYDSVRSIRVIEKALDRGNAILLAYAHRSDLKSGHVIFIDGVEGIFFNAYNVNGNGAEYKPRLNRFLRGFPGMAWAIGRST